jgi:alpha-tubulin suppressor-like RCC1 family protein
VEVGRWPTGPLAEIPTTLAEAGNQIFFGYHDIEDSGGGWGSFSLSSPDDVSIWDHIEGPVQTAVLTTTASDPNILVVASYYGQVGRYDVSTRPPRQLAWNVSAVAGADPRLSADGATLMLAGPAPVDPTTLTQLVNPRYDSALDRMEAVAITADSSVVAVGADSDGTTTRVRMWPKGGGTPLRVVPVEGQVVWRGMAFTSDASRLYVVTGNTSYDGNQPVLHVLNRPIAPKPVESFGWNGLGQLGSGSAVDAHVPTSIPTGAVAMAAGTYHSLALGGDGTVWAWGWNGFGQLGNGGTASSAGPVRVPGLSGVVSVAAGVGDSFAVTRDGTVWGWGWNAYGQLGDGTTVDRWVPVRVPGLTGVASVSAGAFHTLALGTAGAVWAWGGNGLGQLGDGTTVDQLRPELVPGLGQIRSIAAGWLHSLAADMDGNVWAWGWNGFGALGDATTTERHTPARLVGIAHVVVVAAGTYHSMALSLEGRMWTWGWNGLGQLGDGTLTDRHQPFEIPGAYTASAISAGLGHSLAVVNDVVVGWGSNVLGQLGDGTVTDRRLPVFAAGLGIATSVAAGGFHSLAL